MGRVGRKKSVQKKKIVPVRQVSSPRETNGPTFNVPGPSTDRFAEIGQQSPRSKRRWYREKEEELCKLWEEERILYDSTAKEYRLPEKRGRAYARIAAILKEDADEVEKHMRTLRTPFSKIPLLPSGSAADRMTARQREILHMCRFLRVHIKGHESLSNLPAKKKTLTNPRNEQTKAAADALAKGGLPENPQPLTGSYAPVFDITSIDSLPEDDLSCSNTVTAMDQKKRNEKKSRGQVPAARFDAPRVKPNFQTKQSKGKETVNNRAKNTQVHAAVDVAETANLGEIMDHPLSEDDDDEPAFYVKSQRNKAVNKQRKKEVIELLEERTTILDKLTSSVAAIAEKRRHTEEETPGTSMDDDHDAWAKLLPRKLRKMDPTTAERFKLFIDQKAFDAVEGNWVEK